MRLTFRELVCGTLDQALGKLLGQGRTLVTPLQAAQCMAALADGSIMPQLRLVLQVQDLRWSQRQKQGITFELYPGEIVGMAALPFDIAVEIELVAEVDLTKI